MDFGAPALTDYEDELMMMMKDERLPHLQLTSPQADTSEDLDASPVQFYSMSKGDASVSPERRIRGESYSRPSRPSVGSVSDWYDGPSDADDLQIQYKVMQQPDYIEETTRVMCTRRRCRSLPAKVQSGKHEASQADGENLRHRAVRQSIHFSSGQTSEPLDTFEYREEHQSMKQECKLLRQVVRETTGMVLQMQRVAEIEREARNREEQERFALQDDLRRVCGQMDVLAQGQRELQQCMMAMCTQWASQQPSQQPQLAAAAPLSAICAGSDVADGSPHLGSKKKNVAADRQQKHHDSQELAECTPMGAPANQQPGQWKRTPRVSNVASRHPGPGRMSEKQRDTHPLKQVVKAASMCLEAKAECKEERVVGPASFF